MYEVNEKGIEMTDSGEFYKQSTFLLCSVWDLMNGLQCKQFKIRKIILEFVFFLLVDLHCKPVKCYINGLQCKLFENKKKFRDISFYFGRFALQTVCIADNNFVI